MKNKRTNKNNKKKSINTKFIYLGEHMGEF